MAERTQVGLAEAVKISADPDELEATLLLELSEVPLAEEAEPPVPDVEVLTPAPELELPVAASEVAPPEAEVEPSDDCAVEVTDTGSEAAPLVPVPATAAELDVVPDAALEAAPAARDPVPQPTTSATMQTAGPVHSIIKRLVAQLPPRPRTHDGPQG